MYAVKEKGQNTIYENFKPVSKKYSETQIEMFIASSISQDMYKSATRMVNSLVRDTQKGLMLEDYE